MYIGNLQKDPDLENYPYGKPERSPQRNQTNLEDSVG